MRIDILIPVYNGKVHLIRLLRSIEKYPPSIEYEVFLWDNGSVDDGVKVAQKMFPFVRVIASPVNIGYAPALNRLIKLSKGDLLCTMNTDIYFEMDIFNPMIDFLLERKELLGVAPVLIKPGIGVVSTAGDRFPNLWTFFVEFFRMGEFINRLFKGFRLWSSLHPYSFYREGDYVNHIEGSFVIYRREAFERYGLFDERFFLYFEDMDFQRRLPPHSLYVFPVIAYHQWGGSEDMKKPELILTRNRSMLIYFMKHRTKIEAILLRAFLRLWGICI